MHRHYIIATRGSQLALWQARYVKSLLLEVDPTLTVSLDVIKTRGDIIQDVPLAKVGGKGLFVKEIEEALLDGRADLAVHSVKDMPLDLPPGLILGCVPAREAATDCFVSRTASGLADLPPGARVGTSSLRRQAQLLARRPDLRVIPLRGNVDTRLRKLREGACDAVILASAGLKRLRLAGPCMEELDPDLFLPAIGQGALGLECREDDYPLLVLLAELEDRATRVCVQAERGLLAGLNGGCQVPIAGLARLRDEENVTLRGLVSEVDGSRLIRGEKSGPAEDAEKLGRELAAVLLERGARAILEKLYPH